MVQAVEHHSYTIHTRARYTHSSAMLEPSQPSHKYVMYACTDTSIPIGYISIYISNYRLTSSHSHDPTLKESLGHKARCGVGELGWGWEAVTSSI